MVLDIMLLKKIQEIILMVLDIESLQCNTGANSNGFGYQALQYNEGEQIM